jgi:hypothetical protein
VVALIQRMVRENRLWGAERILRGLHHAYHRAA